MAPRCSVPFISLFLLLTLAAGSSVFARDFHVKRDAFAFSNDTVFAYGVDERGSLHITRRDRPPEGFTHRCFVLARGVMQFQQFAEFAPKAPKVSREEYRLRLKKLFRYPVWGKGPRQKIVFPGYRDLYEFSAAYQGLLKETLGNWVPSYLRIGNWRMGMGHLRSGQAAAARWMEKRVSEDKLCSLYLARFPKLNHVVVAYAVRRQPNGDLHFSTYDPNYPGESADLIYRASERSFDFAKRWYFPGGRVNVMRIYVSSFH